MRYRGALEINRHVRDAERQQVLLRGSEWSYVARPGRASNSLPVRRWLAAALHGLAVRIEPRTAGQWGNASVLANTAARTASAIAAYKPGS